MGLLKTAARAAVASSVHGRVQRRQQARWAAAHQPEPAASPTHAAPVHFTAPPAEPAPAGLPTEELLSQLERLSTLRDSGVLTEAEFAAQKARILS